VNTCLFGVHESCTVELRKYKPQTHYAINLV